MNAMLSDRGCRQLDEASINAPRSLAYIVLKVNVGLSFNEQQRNKQPIIVSGNL
jgi:hypothetical protein